MKSAGRAASGLPFAERRNGTSNSTGNRRPTKMPTREKPKAARNRRRKRQKNVSPFHKPDEMSLESWQIALRRQFGRKQKFKFRNLGTQPVFSDFEVLNPQTKKAYRVAVRGAGLGDNFCSCPDFATNSLGTCKHVEFALARLRQRKGTSAALRAGFRPAHSEVYLRYGAKREVCLRPGTEFPTELARIAGKYFDSQYILRPDAIAGFDVFLSEASRFDHELRCFDDVLGFVAEIRDRARREKTLEAAFPRGIRSSAFDKLVKVSLYDYQREGALFAARAGRCLIGDEMGLGKTIQAIAAVEIMARHFGVERVLIICPTSLKHQWEREIARFADRSAQVVAGGRVARQQGYAVDAFYKIVNYDTIHRDLDLIADWSPDLVILDEAQRIKNWKTRAARSTKQIASPYAIVLTGTPLENRLEELVSIIQFVDQHRLGPTFRFLAEHQIHEAETGRVVGYKNLDSIGRTLAPILLRRRKKQVLDQLPERLDKHLFVPMTPQQMQHHDENRELVGRIVKKWRRLRFLSEADQRRLMIALQNMRMSCDSTYLLDQETDFGVKADELTTLLEEMFEQPDTKVVIFSQWVRMHELLVRRLAPGRWGHVMFHGGVPGPRRKHLIDRFREDDNCRAFLSTDAGGVGLNLQHASVVVNVDLPWNPAVLEQRIGRVHRLGQRQPVRVVNFVSQGTIEEGMLSVLKFKTSLFAGALDGGNSRVLFEGGRLKRFMETVEKATESIPAVSAQDPPSSDQEDEPSTSTESPMASSQPQNQAAFGAGNAWSGLIETGLSMLQQLAAASRPSANSAPESSPAGISLVHRDERTGESYLKLPMPNPEVIDQVLTAVSTLLDRFRK
jgi:superfamily II DNA or RNA helicase